MPPAERRGPGHHQHTARCQTCGAAAAAIQDVGLEERQGDSQLAHGQLYGRAAGGEPVRGGLRHIIGGRVGKGLDPRRALAGGVRGPEQSVRQCPPRFACVPLCRQWHAPGSVAALAGHRQGPPAAQGHDSSRGVERTHLRDDPGLPGGHTDHVFPAGEVAAWSHHRGPGSHGPVLGRRQHGGRPRRNSRPRGLG